jgi:hypothetical protein
MLYIKWMALCIQGPTGGKLNLYSFVTLGWSLSGVVCGSFWHDMRCTHIMCAHTAGYALHSPPLMS